MWRNSTCGNFLDMRKFVWFYELLALTCQVNRWYVSHCFVVRTFLMDFTLFCSIMRFIAIHAVCCETCFVAIYTLSVWRQLRPRFCPWRKITNIMYAKISKQIYTLSSFTNFLSLDFSYSLNKVFFYWHTLKMNKS